MGKGTDKLYITHSEWSSTDGSSFGPSSGYQNAQNNAPFRRLPYNYCALSLQPYEHPVCTRDGTVFDLMNIVPWLKKHGTNPVTGEKMEYKELIKLLILKNEDGELCDPVTFKPFTDSTHIVAIATSGNVFAWDTIERLNIKAKNWRDLVSDDEFSRKDIITIQDPRNVAARDMSKFKYLQEGASTLTEEQEKERANPLNNINLKATGSMGKILAAKAAVEKARIDRAQAQKDAASKQLAKGGSGSMTVSHAAKSSLPYNAAMHTTGKAAASLTSTAVSVHTGAERALLSEEEYMLKPKRVKIKGYARMVTSLGNLNIELNPEFAPKAVYNFVKLAQKGYYNGVSFHRNVKSFMIQGGDPTGTGRGGQSYWGSDFKDEFEGPLVHDARGILSMANKGKNTNSSQFFITYREARHLDKKHTIFGKVVGGFDVLDKMEAAPTDPETARPKKAITIKEVVVFVDPFQEFLSKQKQQEEEEKAEEAKKALDDAEDEKTTWTGKRLRADGKVAETESSGVGKYLKQAQAEAAARQEDEILEEAPLEEYYEPVKKKAKTKGFGNFDAW